LSLGKLGDIAMLMSCSLGDGRTRKGMSIREGQSYEISLIPALEKI